MQPYCSKLQIAVALQCYYGTLQTLIIFGSSEMEASACFSCLTPRLRVKEAETFSHSVGEMPE